MSSPLQCDLFARPLPAGVIHRTDFLSHDEEAGLLGYIRSLPLAHSQYRQFTAKRRTVNYGFAYPWKPERKRDVFAIELEPRSAYILRHAGRWGWQHSIPPTKELRYSITFRTAREGTARPRQR